LSGPGRRWIILPSGRFAALQVLDGQDERVVGRKGIVTDLNGGYFIELLGPGRRPGTVRFRNRPDQGRQAVPAKARDIELELVYPLIKGSENIRAFYATSSDLYAIIPNKAITADAIPLVTNFATRYIEGWGYFRDLNSDTRDAEGLGILDRRSTWRTRMRPLYERIVERGSLAPMDVPFYAIYDVGTYTFAPYKVVWAEMAGTLRAAVIGGAVVPFGGGQKPIVPDHKVYFAPFDDLDYAHYVCAFLNSEPLRTFIDGFTIKIQVGTLFRHVKLPEYDAANPAHQDLARCSKEAHQILAAANGDASISAQTGQIDMVAAGLL